MKKLFITAAALACASPAFAHHPLNGAPMTTFVQGMLSGVGHPVLGFDHLFFIALVGIAALYTGRKFIAPLAFIAAMLIATLMVSFGVVIPAVEPMIAVSLIALGYVVASGRALSMASAVGLFALSGLFHGAAFGDTIATQETAIGGGVLIGYLLGLGVVQYLIALGAGYVALNVWKASESSAIQPRLAGAVVGGIGAFLALETVESAAFSALGLG